MSCGLSDWPHTTQSSKTASFRKLRKICSNHICFPMAFQNSGKVYLLKKNVPCAYTNIRTILLMYQGNKKHYSMKATHSKCKQERNSDIFVTILRYSSSSPFSYSKLLQTMCIGSTILITCN